MTTIGDMVLLLVLCVVYFVPTIVAMARNCAKKVGIIVLNVFLGWTLIGWVLALVWAVSDSEEKKTP